MANVIMKKFNANPWHQRIGDCAIRALVIGLGFDYKEACKQLGVACKRGHGLVRNSGIDLYDIKSKFSSFFDVVEDFEEDQDFVPDEFKGSEDDIRIQSMESSLKVPGTLGITLREFIQLFKGQGQFLVGLITNDDKKDGHIVFVNCAPGMGYAVDTFSSSLNFLVDSYMRIKHRLPKDDPKHFKLDPVTKEFIA